MQPARPHDWDGINESILLDIDWKGQPRKVLVHPGAQRLLYVIDRTTGEVLSAEPSTRDQRATRRRPEDRAAQGQCREGAACTSKVVRDICPTAPGAKDWNPSAFSHETGLLYIPHNNLCMDWESVGAELHRRHALCRRRGAHESRARRPYAASSRPGTSMQGKEVWTINESFPVWSGALATGGRRGRSTARWKAGSKRCDARTGEVLWQFKTGSGIIGQPTTYRGPDGKQYVAILSGVGGWSGAIVSGDLDPRDGTAALGFVNAMRDLQERHDQGRNALCVQASVEALRLRCCCSFVARRRTQARELRVCADPNNLPFSNERGEGFENKIVELIAQELGRDVDYTWWAQRRGFLRNTLKAGICDLVPGMPGNLEMACAPRALLSLDLCVRDARGRAPRFAPSTIPRCGS